MSKRKRRTFTPSEKISILKEHLIDRKSVPDICDAYDLQQAVFIAGKPLSLKMVNEHLKRFIKPQRDLKTLK